MPRDYESMSVEELIEAMGWDDHSLSLLLLEFITEQGLEEELQACLAEHAGEESDE